MKRRKRKRKVLKPTVVTTSPSTRLQGLRRQTWKSKLLPLKAFCFKASCQLGLCVPLISCHYNSILSSALVRPICLLSLVWMSDFYFCAYAWTPPFFAISASLSITSFKSVVKLPFFRRCDEKSKIPRDGECDFNPGLTLIGCVSLDKLTIFSWASVC